ncbi:chemotaxis protein [Saccharospirillum mangrovi]|uniref:chemotaxis protein n=1 Tax=Saccharospirillum mangrovi TaxID=2161747 RepID=UPI000D391448|nr:chemotaxis protein [Saccharospirillum mangrovi]
MNIKANKHAQKLLLFSLTGKQSFAIGTLKVREIIPFRALSKLPQDHPAVLGATTVRRTTIPVIDMAAAVGYQPLTAEELPHSSIIITDVQRKEVGFVVRRIEKIVDTNWRDVKPPPNMLGKNAYLTGLFMDGDHTIQLLDVELLLSRIYPDPPGKRYATLTDVQREQLQPLNILLVDDSHVARKQLSDALDNMNIPYKVTTHGLEALDVMERSAREGRPIDILVSDIEMPGLDGYELAFKIRDVAELKRTYIILHTSLNSEMSLTYANQVGANEALTKFDADELVHAMLRGAQSLAAN